MFKCKTLRERVQQSPQRGRGAGVMRSAVYTPHEHMSEQMYAGELRDVQPDAHHEHHDCFPA